MITVNRKKFVVDEATFQPKLLANVSLELSLETLLDAASLGTRDALHAKIGADLLDKIQLAYSTTEQMEEIRHIHEDGFTEADLIADGFQPVTDYRQLWYRLK
jgi:hypothetical protein